MRIFRNMDLYKAIVLLSLVLLPLGGYLCMKQQESIKASQDAIYNATRPGGMLEQIGGLQRKVEVVAQNKRSTSDAINQPSTYFEGQLLAAGGNTVKTDDFTLTGPKEEPAFLGKSKQKAADFVFDVTWKRSEPLPLAFIYSVLFNCESGAGLANDPAHRQSVWKLREFTIVNASDERLLSSYKTPPAELADKWSVKSMKFARREPRKT